MMVDSVSDVEEKEQIESTRVLLIPEEKLDG